MFGEGWIFVRWVKGMTCLCSFVPTFSWKTKQDSEAVAWSAVRSFNCQKLLDIISVSRNSSGLETFTFIFFFFIKHELLKNRISEEVWHVSCSRRLLNLNYNSLTASWLRRCSAFHHVRVQFPCLISNKWKQGCSRSEKDASIDVNPLL